MNDTDKISEVNEKIAQLKTLVKRACTDTKLKSELEHCFEEIKRTFSAFKNNMLDFREISDHLYDGIYIADGEGKTIFVNEAYTRLTGIKKEQVIGRTVKEISEEGKLFKGAVTTQVLEKKERISSIGKSLANQKEHLVTGSPIFDEKGNIKYVVINNRDISELRELELKISKLQNDKLITDEELKFLRKKFTNKLINSKDKDMQSIMGIIDNIAPTDVSVLITGESGTGKEVIADEIYIRSKRNQKPFIKINCAAIPSELLESELFGYEKGAFTDAKKTGKIGMFELANEGTILLDEIGDMPLKLQTKMLRVIQNKEIFRLGSNKPIKLDIRIIASTNKNLHEEMINGRFREDLYYRLKVVPIFIKPLRERIEDIERLAHEFIERNNNKYGKRTMLEKKALKVLEGYHWPGNIRELENVIERMVVINNDGFIRAESLINILNTDDVPRKMFNQSLTLKEALREIEKEMIEAAIQNYGSVNKAAKYLGLSQPALWKKCKNMKIKFN